MLMGCAVTVARIHQIFHSVFHAQIRFCSRLRESQGFSEPAANSIVKQSPLFANANTACKKKNTFFLLNSEENGPIQEKQPECHSVAATLWTDFIPLTVLANQRVLVLFVELFCFLFFFVSSGDSYFYFKGFVILVCWDSIYFSLL